MALDFKMFGSKASKAVASTVKANVAASAAARATSKANLKGVSKGINSAAKRIETMPNKVQGRVERSIARSKGQEVVDKGRDYDRAQRRAKAAKSAPAAAAQGSSAPAAGGSEAKNMIGGIKKTWGGMSNTQKGATIAAGAGAAGYAARAMKKDDQQPQYQGY